MAQWYYAQEDEQFGPVSAAGLKELADQGTLDPEDLIWREGMERWAPAHKVRGLFPDIDAPPSANDQTSADPPVNGEMPMPNPPAPPERFKADDGEAESESQVSEPDNEPPLDETAIDELPLASPEESRLHVPSLGTPRPLPRDQSEPVVFEPEEENDAASHAMPPPVEQSSSGSGSVSDYVDEERTHRVDAAPRQPVPVTLIVQTFLWMNCLVVVVLGGPVACFLLLTTPEMDKRLLISASYLTVVAMTYVTARTVERMLRLADRHWGEKRRYARRRRSIEQRNRERFQ